MKQKTKETINWIVVPIIAVAILYGLWGINVGAFVLGLFVLVFIIMIENSAKQRAKDDEARKVKFEVLKVQTFPLREMAQKDLIHGEMKGSFLLIMGSIYGMIEEKMYLVVTYLDVSKNVHKIKKFNLEEIEIVTIGSGEAAYFKYDNCYLTAFELKYGEPRLYLPEGWAILGR